MLIDRERHSEDETTDIFADQYTSNGVGSETESIEVTMVRRFRNERAGAECWRTARRACRLDWQRKTGASGHAQLSADSAAA